MGAEKLGLKVGGRTHSFEVGEASRDARLSSASSMIEERCSMACSSNLGSIAVEFGLVIGRVEGSMERFGGVAVVDWARRLEVEMGRVFGSPTGH